MQPADPRIQDRRALLGETVRRLRSGHGWTQEQLATRTGFDRKSINRLENGTYSPAVDRLYPLADALGVPVARLFADDPGLSPTEQK